MNSEARGLIGYMLQKLAIVRSDRWLRVSQFELESLLEKMLDWTEKLKRILDEEQEALRWIPVEERLPERDGRYEVWQIVNRSGKRQVNICCFGTDFTNRRGWMFGGMLYLDDDSGVTHWRELREGPMK